MIVPSSPLRSKKALDHFSKNWNSDIWTDELEERTAFSQGVGMLQRYYADNRPSDARVIALESRFGIEIDGGDDTKHVLSGIIDRIDKTEDGYEIIDYKTTRKMPSQDKVDHDLQLTIYLRAFLERYPAERKNIDKVTFSLYFLKHGVKLSSKRTEADLPAGAMRIVSAARAPNTRTRPRRLGLSCIALVTYCTSFPSVSSLVNQQRKVYPMRVEP